MKTLVVGSVFFICLALGIFSDMNLIAWLTGLVPIGEWAGLIKAGIVIGVVFATFSAIITISIIVATLISALIK